MMNINTDYCFLDDVLGEPFETIYYPQESTLRTMNGKPYIDPDDKSKALYETHACLLKAWIDTPYEVVRKSGKYELQGVHGRLGSDYIGCSSYWATKASVTSAELTNYLKISRTIGGHVVWPRIGNLSINPCRGGSRGFYDRLDLTLLDLKNWFEGKPARLASAFDAAADFLTCSGNDFASFVDTFCLNPFVDSQYRPYDGLSFADGEFHNVLTEMPGQFKVTDRDCYLAMMAGSMDAIQKRNRMIGDYIHQMAEVLPKVYSGE